MTGFTGRLNVFAEGQDPLNDEPAGEVRVGSLYIAGVAVSPSGGELNVLDGAIADVEWAVAAGASNVCVMTGTIKDADGATIAAVRNLRVYLSTDATGIGVSATSYSTGAAVSDGTQVAAITANKVFDVQTGVDGVFAISITASGKPATEYGVAVIPLTGQLSVSDASAALWGA